MYDTCIIARDELAAALRRIQMPEAQRHIPILSHVHIQREGTRLHLSADDMDVRLTTSIDVEGPAEINTAVHAATLRRVVAQMPAHRALPISLTPEGRFRLGAESRFRLGPAGGTVLAELATQPAADVPAPRDVVGVHALMSAPALRRLFARVRHAISTDETRYYLNGIRLEVADCRLHATATDGHRLATQHCPVPDGLEAAPPATVPAWALAAIDRLLAGADSVVRLTIGETHLALIAGEDTLTTKLIDGHSYPDWRGAIPAEPGPGITIERGRLLAALHRARSLRGEDPQWRRITLAITPGALHISADNPDAGSITASAPATVEIEPGAWPEDTGFQARFLLAAIEQITGDVQIRLTSVPSSRPAVTRRMTIATLTGNRFHDLNATYVVVGMHQTKSKAEAA